MASTKHTEKFLVEVQYGGSRKTFDDLFRPRHLDEFNAKIVEHNVKKVATKPIRSVDEQAIREILRQSVEAAGYTVGNKAKAKLGPTDARVDYAAKQDYYNDIMDELVDNRREMPNTFSIYLPHIYVAVQFREPNLHLLGGWYKEHGNETKRKKTTHKNIYKVRQEQPKYDQSKGGYYTDEDGKQATEWVWRDDYKRRVYLGRQTLCLSDPQIITQLAEYLKDLEPEKVNRFVEAEEAKAEIDMIEQDKKLGLYEEE